MSGHTEARLPQSLASTAASGSIPLTFHRSTGPIDAALGWTRGTHEAVAPEVEPLLSTAEKARLAELEFPRRRDSYLLGRGAAKCSLRLFLQEPDVSRMTVASGVFDQPLVEHPSRGGVGVTITHTEGLALAVAFPAGHPIGIDVEWKRASRFPVLLAQLTPAERHWAGEAEIDELTSATLLWTAKESLAKALTTGLMSPWEIYETSEWQLLAEGVYRTRFPNFAQYQALTWITGGVIFSLALPKHSQPTPATVEAIRQICLRQPRGAGSWEA